jgi:hypothetical protein
MTRFLHWRKMTWAILLGSVAMAAWIIAGGGVVMIAFLWSFGIVFLGLIWFLSRPLWRQGHGFRIRRLRSPGSGPARSFEGLATGN